MKAHPLFIAALQFLREPDEEGEIARLSARLYALRYALARKAHADAFERAAIRMRWRVARHRRHRFTEFTLLFPPARATPFPRRNRKRSAMSPAGNQQ